MSNTTINFAKLGGRAYAGRDNGKAAKEYFHISEKIINSNLGDKIRVIFPDETKTLTSSYFLGCFGESIIALGSKEKFAEHCELSYPDKLRKVTDKGINTALMATSAFS